jgi:hypothetical protein
MLKLPVLKNVYFQVVTRGIERLPVHHKACNLVRQLSVPASPTEDRPPFRFTDLPVEIQCRILESADLVAPSVLTSRLSSSKLKGFALLQCFDALKSLENGFMLGDT